MKNITLDANALFLLDLKLIINERGMMLIDKSLMAPTKLVIPSIITYKEHNYKIVSIGANTFKDCKTLKEVVLPNSVISIGENAFKNCSSLKRIELPKNLKEISSFAFENCTNLQHLELDKTIKTGKDIFKNSILNQSLDDLLETNKSFKEINNYFKEFDR